MIKREESSLPPTLSTVQMAKGRNWRRITGVLFMLGGLVMLLAIMVGESVYPGYSVHTNAISDLAAIGTETSYFVEPASFLWGLSWVIGGYILTKDRGMSFFAILNLLPGIGVLLATFSPENVNLTLHIIGAGLAFIPGALVMLTSYRFVKRGQSYILIALGLLSVVGIIVEFGFYGSTLFSNTLGPGGWERIIVFPELFWLMVLGAFILSEENPVHNAMGGPGQATD